MTFICSSLKYISQIELTQKDSHRCPKNVVWVAFRYLLLFLNTTSLPAKVI